MITPRRFPRSSVYARISQSELYDYTDILLVHYHNGRRHTARIVHQDDLRMPVAEWVQVDEAEVAEPTMRLSREVFMALADAVLDHLEQLGLLDRQSPERYKAELNATMRHLHDLRLISFQALGVEEPEPMIVRKTDGPDQLPTG